MQTQAGETINPALQERIALTTTLVTRLEAANGVPEWRTRQDPMDELVSCILSQHTSDTNTFRAFASLKAAFPTWESLVAAPTRSVANAIRMGGLANSKAPRIQAVLEAIRERRGSISLDFLDAMSDAEARSYLRSLPGVGPKTAAIVLCFALDRPVLPVDTHVFRVAWRLGLIEKRLGEAKAHDALQAQILPALTYRFHVALIQHGRKTCKAPIPRCPECPLTDLCRFYRQAQAPEETHIDSA